MDDEFDIVPPKRIEMRFVNRVYIQNGSEIVCRVLPTMGNTDTGVHRFTMRFSSEADAKTHMKHMALLKAQVSRRVEVGFRP